MTTMRQDTLANGLEIIFRDESNRYFGDYHRVCVVVEISCRLDDLDDRVDAALLGRAREMFGDRLTVARRFERMGVPTAEVDTVRRALVDHFMQHSASYLARADYPGLLLAAELRKRNERRFYA